ncbi:MAG: hypothetical protein KJ838_01250, partial [Candidatus Omnitrophica bacterium]|nr:hypothetical protein [Candidatus Omnitrophota bacterium]
IEGNTYIFEILAIDPSGKKTLAEVRDEINKILFNQKLQNAMLVWMEKLESDAYIEIKGDYAGR